MEEYVLTRADHRDQTQAEKIAEHARKLVDNHLADLRQRLGPDGFEQHENELCERLRPIFARKTPDHELMRWRLRLYCGHIVIRIRHASMANPTMHGCSNQQCPECGKDPSSIVAYEPVGFVAEPPGTAEPATVARRPTRAQLEQRIQELEKENERLRKPHRQRLSSTGSAGGE